MKTLFSYFRILAFTAVSLLFLSSCDDDVDRAVTLSGQWYGDFGMYYIYDYPNGDWEQFDSYDTDIIFYPDYDYATHGWGKQVDWYKYGPYERMYYRFNWEIRDGVIYLDYPHDPDLSTKIFDYCMNSRHFSGHFGHSDSKFRLDKIADYYDWRDYNDDWDYHYWYYDNWRGTRTDSGEMSEGTVVKRGNRFADR